jgi:hypothetical protein
MHGAEREPFSVLLFDRTDVLTRAFPIRTALLALAAALALRGEMIDRIAISVGNRVITESDIDREIRVTAFQNGVKPDFSVAVRKETARRLVEQKLVRRELETSRYPTPSPSEVLVEFEKIKQSVATDDAGYQRALTEYGVTEQDLKDAVLWQLTLLLFTEVRFRPSVQVSDQEIRDYFEKVIRPAAEQAHPDEPIALEDYRDRIESTLAEPRVLKEVDRWLTEARRRTEIVYHDEELL